MSRFKDIIDRLHATRIKLVEDNRARKRKKGGGGRKKKAPRKITFDSPELEEIFNSMPEECKELIRKGK